MCKENHSFWSKQPVGVEEGANEVIKYPTNIPTEPYVLPEGFFFENIKDCKELSEFLSENYVEDLDNEFRLVYSESFFNWFMNSPKHRPEYSLGLKLNKILVGYIFGKETDIMINGKTNRVAAINFLCVTKDLRSKRFTPILIKEMTRRFNCNGIFQGIFTAGTPLFFELSNAKYWHRPLNCKMLMAIDFIDRIVDLPPFKKRNNTRRLEDKDVSKCYDIYKKDITKYKVVDNMDEEEFTYFIKNEVMRVFVNEVDNEIRSFGSYFLLDTMAIKKNLKITGAYLSLICGNNVREMIEDLVYCANEEKCDVFNGIDIAEAGKFLPGLGFLEGSGDLKYYLYNWKSGKIDRSDVFYYMH